MRNRRKSKFLYTAGGFLLFFVILFIILMVVYNRRLESISESLLSTEEIVGLVPNTTNSINTVDNNNLEEASSIISKTITEALNQTPETVEETEEKVEVENKTTTVNTSENETKKEEEEPKKELSFSYPVEGEIMKDFSMESLIFSETLQEWTVHQGIDIKADRTTVVKSAEEGTVTAIKNDPRYGMTIIIEHEDGYKTVYSNLLSTEFVTEGEKVKKGQSIGTVGNSAAFEIADEAHLHFEMIKDGEYVDPKTYLK